MRTSLSGIFTIFACAVALSSQTLSPDVRRFVTIEAPVVALTHVRVIDGTGIAPREDQTVMISKGKIESISDSVSANFSQGCQGDRFAWIHRDPGVGRHARSHFLSHGQRNIRRNGIQLSAFIPCRGSDDTIRTTGSIEPYADLELKKQIDGGKTPGPKIHVTGPYLEGPETFAVQMHELAGPDDATRTVNFWLDQGVDNFKAYMLLLRPNFRRPSMPPTSGEPKLPGTFVHWIP